MVGFALAGIAYGLGNSTGAGDPSPPPKLAADALDRVADGDLIFRRGTDTSSAIVVSASSRGAQYSHVGVMIRQPTGLYVVHAMPAEGKKTGGVLMERLEDFIADDVSRFAAIIPVKGTEAERKTVTRYLTSLIGKPFDDAMAMSTEDAFYCTELPVKGWLRAGRPLAVEGTRYMMMPEPIITPESLYQAAQSAQQNNRLPSQDYQRETSAS